MENTSSQNHPIRFGSFELDVRAGELRKQGVKIKLQEQPFQILVMLLGHPGEVVTREELRQKLWPENTFVDFDHGLNKAINKLREALGDSAENPHFIETLAKHGYRFIRDRQARPGQIRSLLVLPLENLSRDPEQEYFADGLTEELITKLARIGELRVLSRTTAMHYKGVRKPLPEIASELQVEGVVEGTVSRSGEQVRISAQLIHAPTDTHLWADSYERDLRNVLSLQSEVAQAIVREVQVKLTPQEQAHFAQEHTVDPEAYEAYLKGRYHWNKRSGEALTKGAECFQRAVEKDPRYAAAYAGLADCAGSAGWLGYVSPNEGCGKAKGLAQKALELDQNLAEAHTSLAWAVMHHDYDFLAAEREYRRSLELNPLNANTRMWFSLLLAATGRLEEGIAECKQAVDLDPLALMVNAGFGWDYWCARRYDEAIEQCNRTLDLDPNFVPALYVLGTAYTIKGMHEPGIATFQKAVELSSGAATYVVAGLGWAYAHAGEESNARMVLEKLTAPTAPYVTASQVAWIFTELGEKEEAFRWLDKAYQEHAAWMAFLNVDSRFDALRPDPRFQDLLRCMNFPQV